MPRRKRWTLPRARDRRAHDDDEHDTDLFLGGEPAGSAGNSLSGMDFAHIKHGKP
jgi:hypothetical protein